MGRKIRTFQCADCTVETTRARQVDDPLICLECGMSRAESAARAMFTHSGPEWEHFAQSNGGPRRKLRTQTQGR